jgi:hypothetical protein
MEHPEQNGGETAASRRPPCVVHSIRSMFCPECKVEYRPGFTRCCDCDVDLVGALSLADNSANELADRSLGTIKRVWSGKDEERCITLCERLKVAGIPFKVDQRRRQYLLRVDEHYVIGVPTEFFDDARKMIIKGRLDTADGAEDE